MPVEQFVVRKNRYISCLNNIYVFTCYIAISGKKKGENIISRKYLSENCGDILKLFRNPCNETDN